MFKPSGPQRTQKRRSVSWFKYLLIGVSTAIITGVCSILLSLRTASNQPVEAYLVLGGSIRREVHVAQLSRAHPQRPVLISTGSADPCIRLIYEKFQAPLEPVWLEKCARSTFGNFVFSVSTLKQWKVRHIGLVTSGSHAQRAVWMAKIILGAHRIWVEPEIVPEQGVPGNQENALKTIADMTRSVLWAGVSQFYSPQCDQIIQLTSVNLAEWRQKGFKCEHQGEIEGS